MCIRLCLEKTMGSLMTIKVVVDDLIIAYAVVSKTSQHRLYWADSLDKAQFYANYLNNFFLPRDAKNFERHRIPCDLAWPIDAPS